MNSQPPRWPTAIRHVPQMPRTPCFVKSALHPYGSSHDASRQKKNAIASRPSSPPPRLHPLAPEGVSQRGVVVKSALTMNSVPLHPFVSSKKKNLHPPPHPLAILVQSTVMFIFFVLRSANLFDPFKEIQSFCSRVAVARLRRTTRCRVVSSIHLHSKFPTDPIDPTDPAGPTAALRNPIPDSRFPTTPALYKSSSRALYQTERGQGR